MKSSLKISPAKLFTRKEAVILSGLTMNQVIKLEQKNLIVPQRQPIRYTWNQIVKLRVIYYARQMLSLQVITDELASFCKTDILISNYEVVGIMNEKGIFVGNLDVVSMELGLTLQRDGVVTRGQTALNVNGETVVTEYTMILMKKIVEEIFDIANKKGIENLLERVEYASA